MVDIKLHERDFPSGPVVKNPPCNAGDTGLIPGWGTKVPRALEEWSPHGATTEAKEPRLERPCTPGKDLTRCDDKFF